MNGPEIIVALDYPEAAPALSLLHVLTPHCVASRWARSCSQQRGPQLLKQFMRQGFDIFS